MKKFKNIWTIAKKEFYRFFKDKRILISLFLPGVLIFCIYSFLGENMGTMMGVDENYTYTMYAVNAPAELEAEFALLESQNVSIEKISESETESAKEKVKSQEADILLVFPSDFSLVPQSETFSQVNVYYNSVKTESSMAYSLVSAVFSGKQYGAPNFLMPVNDLSTAEDMTGMIVSMIGPMMIMVFLFTGCLALVPESIAGEKERGSFATMLVTPVKRSHIAVGKILALSTLSLLSGVCSALGLIFSLPKLLGSAEGITLGVPTYQFGDYAMLLGIILSTVLVMVGIVSVVSTLAKSVKEAAGMVGPLNILIILLGFGTMFSTGADAWYWYLIPLFNSARALGGILSFNIQPLYAIITILINLGCVAGLSIALAKMFDSEKIM